ncbi:unnamed protein product [Parnassius apollo]|uniref:(apollo) hypothetical protein n=1 Tax=Parnassius apollo TaxID=110799 RepID=A0A8S3WVW8_PARAO|nr:unnamed protein product [Parnassius apollo]
MQRTPPQKIKCMSSPDLHSEIDSTNNFVTCRKRKEMDDTSENSTIFSNNILNEKYIEKLVTNSVRSVLSAELTKITDALTNIQLAVAGIISDNTALKNSLLEVNNKLMDIDNTLCSSELRQDSFDARIKVLEEKIQQVSERNAGLENKLSLMEQQARSNNLEISNLPEKKRRKSFLL